MQGKGNAWLITTSELSITFARRQVVRSEHLTISLRDSPQKRLDCLFHKLAVRWCKGGATT